MNKLSKLGIILIIGITTALSACKSNQEKEYDEIVKLEKELFGDRSELNDSIARIFLQKSDVFIKAYKEDPNTPELLFKTGEVLNGLQSYNFAIRKFQEVFLRYPKSNKAAESIFICGFIYENNLQNYEEAGNYYRKFLREYPNNPFAKDAKIALENLGKTPEEMVREFEKKNQATN